ncbi:MAG: vitamin K epoxide reductase family protein [Acidobacteria bacterium]|nr:vitamin K epoxide reductase family protein [Acidobacteriota bacterium]
MENTREDESVDRQERGRAWIPVALAAKVAFDAANAAKLSVDQWTKHRAFCFWCLLAAGATFACTPLVVTELRAAIAEIGRDAS